MIPKTKAHIPPEIEQEMTIEPPAKRFFGVLAIGLALVLASHLAGFPRLTKPETGQPPVQKAEGMPDQLPDLSAGAEYQFRLSGGDFAMVDSREFAVVEVLPDLVQDRAYHSRLSDTNFGHVKDRESVVMDEMPNQIPDHQALADYQALLGSGDFSRLGGRKLADVAELPDLVQDRAYHSHLRDLLSSRPTEKLKTDQLKAPEKQFGKGSGNLPGNGWENHLLYSGQPGKLN